MNLYDILDAAGCAAWKVKKVATDREAKELGMRLAELAIHAGCVVAAAVAVTVEELAKHSLMLANEIGGCARELAMGLWSWCEPPRYPWEEVMAR